MKMNKKRLIIAGIIFLVGLLLRFGFSGHDLIAYGLFLVSVLIVVFGVVGKTLKQLIALLLAMGVVYFAIIEIPIIDEASGDGDFDADYLSSSAPPCMATLPPSPLWSGSGRQRIISMRTRTPLPSSAAVKAAVRI